MRTLRRSTFLCVCLFFVLPTPFAAADAEQISTKTKRPPNIVLIGSDDQGYRDLGCFGSKEIKTPHLDRLAREGVRCTSFCVTWPACTPSQGSLLSGRYP